MLKLWYKYTDINTIDVFKYTWQKALQKSNSKGIKLQ